MAKTPAMIITGIAIALLVIYAADVSSSINLDGEVGEKGDGFLPLDDMQRGMGLRGPAIILPIIAFFISLRESSKGLGGMIIIAGVLILIGGIAMVGTAAPEGTDRDPMSSVAML
ncbi:MAG: hypothetical protein CMO18_03660, partial [Thaumarchaeota archaeon]|nr:hypothetical protein [Nitrososphaerota archaeon]